MSAWNLYSYDTRTMMDDGERIAHYIARGYGRGGYSVKLLRDIHRALQSLSDEDYARVRALLESEEELYE